MNNSKKGLVAVIFLSITFIVVLTLGVINDKKIAAKNEKEYQEYINNKTATEEATFGDNQETNGTDMDANAQASAEAVETLGFYDKIKAKQDVKILILGDGLALSQGRNSDNGIWSDGVSNLIKSNYGVNVQLNVLAASGSTAEIGLNTINSNDISGYDLIIVCYGQCDNNISVDINTFKSNYSNIITKIKTSNPKATIIPILSSNLDTTNTYRLAIMDIANENNLTCADMKKAFNDSGIKQSSLTNNTLPTDQGYQVYTQTIGNIIKAGMN